MPGGKGYIERLHQFNSEPRRARYDRTAVALGRALALEGEKVSLKLECEEVSPEHNWQVVIDIEQSQLAWPAALAGPSSPRICAAAAGPRPNGGGVDVDVDVGSVPVSLESRPRPSLATFATRRPASRPFCMQR